MKLSIIIPTLNESPHIVDFLNHLIPLCHSACEVVLVDGGSMDKTIELAKKFVDNIVVSKKGRSIQQNTGAKKATGDYFLFLHADSVLANDFLKEIEFIASSEQCQWGHFDVQLSGSHKGLRVVEYMMNLRSRLTGIATGDQGIFVSKKLFFQVGGFADLALMEDINLSSRLKQYSRPYCSKLKIKTSSRRWEKNGIFKTILSMWWYRLQFFFGVDSKKIEKRYYS